ncbi:UDP-N-acetylmuramate dehydrogenase [Marinobacter mobilis]
MSAPIMVGEGVSLERFNTLGIDVQARYFTEVKSLDQLTQALDWARQRSLEVLVLGGGSNLVFAGNVEGLVVRIAMAGRQWADVNDDHAKLVLGAGERWHDAVIYAAKAGYRGIENLALIPGTAGAAPVQNIGAYGVELKDTLTEVVAWDRETSAVVTLSVDECQFGYRDSLFKRCPERYIILEISLCLSRSAPLNLGYGELQAYFSERQSSDALTALDVAEGVVAIRRRKLPDPESLPNVGSFFKNPVVPLPTWDRLRQEFPEIAAYPAEHSVKLAAAWLIDQCGWKGYRNERVGVHSRQALVLVNHAGGNGTDILDLANRIRADVRSRFGVELEMEPRVVPAPARV